MEKGAIVTVRHGVQHDIGAAAAIALFLRGWRDNPSTDIDSAMNRKAPLGEINKVVGLSRTKGPL